MAMGGCLFVIGGHDGVAAVNTVERWARGTGSVKKKKKSGLSVSAATAKLSRFPPARYDPKTNTWAKQVPMPTRRTRAAAAVLGGHLYVMGGSDGDGALGSGEPPFSPTSTLKAHHRVAV